MSETNDQLSDPHKHLVTRERPMHFGTNEILFSRLYSDKINAFPFVTVLRVAMVEVKSNVNQQATDSLKIDLAKYTNFHGH